MSEDNVKHYDNEKFVSIFSGEVKEAEMVRAVLEENSIEAYINEEIVTAFLHSFIDPTDTVEVQVLEHDLAKAKECIAAAKEDTEREWPK